MNVIAWITEVGWEACVDAAAGVAASEITLLHVAAPVHPGPGLLGRHAPPGRYEQIAGEAGEELLDAAVERLGDTRAVVHRVALPGRPEDIVTSACTGADLLVMSRNGHRPGPHSLEHANRFVVDHAPCTVLLTWP
jgi:nucleotide-binding universal stress UspA family protein